MNSIQQLQRFSAACLIGLTAIAGTARVTLAEDAPKPPDAPVEQRRGPGQMLGRLAENLGQLDLSPDQKGKAKTLLDNTRQQLQALREQNLDRAIMGEK